MYQNEEHRKDVNERGDGYEYIGSYYWNEVTIEGKNKSNSKTNYIRVKCPYCGKEYDVQLSYFKKGGNCKYCCNSYEKSLAYYIQHELGKPLNKYWDWEKNNLNPYLVNKNTSQLKIWIKCDKINYHGSYSIYISNFHQGNRCPYCTGKSGKTHHKDSFGQWLIDTYGEGAIKKYWSPKNTISPFDIAPQSNKKVWLLCQEHEYHNDKGGYFVTVSHFYKGSRCGYCGTYKVHPLDSFGSLYPEKAKYWSENNKKSPFEVMPMSNKKYKFICEECGAEFERSLAKINRNDIYNENVICKKCNSSRGEIEISKVLNNMNVEYIHDKEYFKDLLSKSGRPLRPDFIIEDKRIWIEYDGEQHFEHIKGMMTKEKYKQLQKHDKLKDKYAKEHRWKLIRIPYWEFDNIEKILEKELNKNN